MASTGASNFMDSEAVIKIEVLRSFQFTGCFQRIHRALSRGVHTVASAECVVLERKNLCVNVCVFSSSQSHCPSALASLPPPLCASLFTGNAGEPYGWLG